MYNIYADYSKMLTKSIFNYPEVKNIISPNSKVNVNISKYSS